MRIYPHKKIIMSIEINGHIYYNTHMWHKSNNRSKIILNPGRCKIMKTIIVIDEIVVLYGSDILSSTGMQLEKKFIQHGHTSVYEHSYNVAYMCIYISLFFRIKVDKRSLVRGALLHDYFLYDWHVPDKSHRFHGFTHAKKALNNAKHDFILSRIEEDMIKKHMFPLNLSPPKYRESIILCIADKICSLKETIGIFFATKK